MHVTSEYPPRNIEAGKNVHKITCGAGVTVCSIIHVFLQCNHDGIRKLRVISLG